MKSSVWFSPAKAAKGDWTYLADAGVEMHLTLGTRELFEDEIRLLKEVLQRDGVDTMLYEVSDPFSISDTSASPQCMQCSIKFTILSLSRSGICRTSG
jgi:ketol-acid reductoisomerase